jgi:hypothetical protein
MAMIMFTAIKKEAVKLKKHPNKINKMTPIV